MSQIIKPALELFVDKTFLNRVYHGPDPARFEALLLRCLDDPHAFVCSTSQNSIGLAVLHPNQPELGNVAVGHYLFGDWKILKRCMAWAVEKNADVYVYPINYSNPQQEQLRNVLIKREGFSPYQEILIKRLNHDDGRRN